MGFRQGAYAKVWKTENKGKYSTAQISISKKKADTNEYITEFQGFVNLVGSAHEAAKSLSIGDKGTTIQITSCDVTNNYDAKTQKSYTNFTVFGFEIPDGNNSSKQTKGSAKSSRIAPAVDNDPSEDELPF